MKIRKMLLLCFYLSIFCCLSDMSLGMFCQNWRKEDQLNLTAELISILEKPQGKKFLILGAHPAEPRHYNAWKPLSIRIGNAGSLTYISFAIEDWAKISCNSKTDSNRFGPGLAQFMMEEEFEKSVFKYENGKLNRLDIDYGLIVDVENIEPEIVFELKKDNVKVIKGNFRHPSCQTYMREYLEEFDVIIFDYCVMTIKEAVSPELISIILNKLTPSGIAAFGPFGPITKERNKVYWQSIFDVLDENSSIITKFALQNLPQWFCVQWELPILRKKEEEEEEYALSKPLNYVIPFQDMGFNSNDGRTVRQLSRPIGQMDMGARILISKI